MQLYIDTPTGNMVSAALGPQGRKKSLFSMQSLLETQLDAEGGPPLDGRGFSGKTLTPSLVKDMPAPYSCIKLAQA